MTLATDPFVLPEDVSITPVDDLPDGVRVSAGASAGDFIVARARSRARARIVNASTAELLECFRAPLAITDAILAFSRKREADPEATLVAAFPPLSEFVRDGFLVREGSATVRGVAPSLPIAARVSEFEVIECIQVLEDTELYKVRHDRGNYGAMKIVGASRMPAAAAMVRHEAALLEHLGGKPTPQLLGAGIFDERAFVVTAWCPGVSPDIAARELHGTARESDAAKLRSLSVAILDAYVELHARMVIHGDVHPRNIIVDTSRRVSLLDLGLARIVDDPSHAAVSRGGVGEYLEPEYARAALAGDRPPRSTCQSDQYSVAVLLFRLFTGASYLDRLLLETELHRAIVERSAPSFVRIGVPAWPQVEAALARALSKDPRERFPSMGDFAAAVRSARLPRATAAARPVIGALDRLRARVLARIGPDGPLLTQGLQTAPVASVNFGSAGIAWAAYRLACIEDRPDLLAVAELWCERTRACVDRPDAFHDPAAGLTPELIGGASLYHALPGVHCVEAAIASALGDIHAIERAAKAFVGASGSLGTKHDLAFGKAGILLGCTFLHEARWSDAGASVDATRRFGDQTARAVGGWMRSLAPIGQCPEFRTLGISHGWAGVLYATLRWCEASRADIPPDLVDRLTQLADCGAPSGHGWQWPWYDDSDPTRSGGSMPGWCNGSAGFVHLWLASHRVLGDDRFLELAELAAWDAWEHPSRAPSLCCGLAGRAYALLAMFRHLGAAMWRDRAWRLAEVAARQPIPAHDAPYADSLFKGQLGIALLAADLDHPGESLMPLFEPEGWARAGRRA